jgi:hypothetical protein
LREEEASRRSELGAEAELSAIKAKRARCVILQVTGRGQTLEARMDEAIRTKILALLDRHRDMSIATLRPDGWPQTTTVGYANDGLTIYFLCGLDSQKAANLARDDRVSLTIDHDTPQVMDIAGRSPEGPGPPVREVSAARWDIHASAPTGGRPHLPRDARCGFGARLFAGLWPHGFGDRLAPRSLPAASRARADSSPSSGHPRESEDPGFFCPRTARTARTLKRTFGRSEKGGKPMWAVQASLSAQRSRSYWRSSACALPHRPPQASLSAMLDLNMLLTDAGIDPAMTIVMRHRPWEPALNRVFRWIAAERPDLFRAYQQTHYERAEAALARAETLVAFIAHGPRRALFVTVYDIQGSRRIGHEDYWAISENRELNGLGMAGLASERTPLLFNLVDNEALASWRGRLVITWTGPERSWWRWAARNTFPVEAITEEHQLVPDMPDWSDLVLTWNELATLPASWRTSLAQWRGVYFIFDSARGRGYVGSAYGADNIFGRWLAYAATGHGGNAQLRKSNPTDLRFSILERTSPDLEPAEVIRLESRWKERLHTRRHGLNDN